MKDRRFERNRSLAVAISAVLLLWAAGSGCAVSRATLGEPLPQEPAEVVKVGMRADQVIEQLGPPHTVTEALGFIIFHYGYTEAKSMGASIIFLSVGRSAVLSDDLYVLMNKKGIVIRVLYQRRTNDLEYQWWPWGEDELVAKAEGEKAGEEIERPAEKPEEAAPSRPRFRELKPGRRPTRPPVTERPFT